MPNSRLQHIAGRIRSDLRLGSLSPMPPIRALAKRYGVSYRTMWKVARMLSSEGLVRLRQGRKIESAAEPAQSAASALAGRIKQDMHDGIFRARQPMPKFDYFVHERGVSRPTVAEAFRLLQTDNLVHKAGKQWHAGPLVRQTGRAALSASPVILLVVRTEKDWYELFHNLFLMPFINALHTECATHRVRLSLLFTEKPVLRSERLPWGAEGARQSARALGDRLRGAIITDAFTDRDTIEAIVRETSSGGRPAVYLDGAGIRADLDAMANSIRGRFHRLHIDEQAAMRIALSGMHAAGHRVLGFPTLGARSPDWLLRRYEAARNLCKREFPDITILTAEHEEKFWFGPAETILGRYEVFAERLAAASSAGPSAPIGSPQRLLLSATPSMSNLLNNGMTGLISCNDWMAYQHFFWCEHAGMETPRRLSMVSFDNNPESEVVPVSTVDFGFGHLGYIAFHLLAGDVPVRLDAKGNVAGVCRLVDRGSIVAPPGAGRRPRSIPVASAPLSDR
jgi:DNA-binding LacI/PurR family transcriptional regulator